MKMKSTLLMLLALLAGPVHAGGLEDFLSNVNAQARVDMNGFSAQVSTQFGVPQVKVRAVIGSVGDPGNAFLVFQLGQWAGLPPERVIEVYESNRGKGWGVIAKQLGIKPGSDEFHRLKSGNLQYSGGKGGGKSGGGKAGGGKDKAKKGKEHGKGKS